MIKSEIKKLIQAAVQKKYPDLPAAGFSVDESPAAIDGDFSSNVAFTLAKALSSSPQLISGPLIDALPANPIIKKTTVSKNGFINFTVQESYLQKMLLAICNGQKWPLNTGPKPNGKVLIEFVSANPTGPLHIGHGRGAALGDSLARIFKQCGYQTETEYYINDRGVQMQTLAASVKTQFLQLRGDRSVSAPETGYKGAYIQEIASKMAAKHREDFDEFPKKYLLDEIRKDLENFGVSFDHWFSESLLHQQGRVTEVLDALKLKDALKEKDGALWFLSQEESSGAEKNEPDKDRVLKKSNGDYTYFASDIAYHKDKFDRGYDQCIDIWGHDHHGYVPRVNSAVAALGFSKSSLKILLYQLVSLKRGGKKVPMSTRAGEFVSLKEILDEVGRDACRFFFAMRSPNSQLEFDVDLAKKQSNENPVYYVQYVHARICSIFKEAEKRGVKFIQPQAIHSLTEPEEVALMKKLCSFDDLLEETVKIFSPHPVADYLIDLSTKFHRFYDRLRVLDAAPALIQERLALLRATQTVVKDALSLLGVAAPDKM